MVVELWISFLRKYLTRLHCRLSQCVSSVVYNESLLVLLEFEHFFVKFPTTHISASYTFVFSRSLKFILPYVLSSYL